MTRGQEGRAEGRALGHGDDVDRQRRWRRPAPAPTRPTRMPPPVATMRRGAQRRRGRGGGARRSRRPRTPPAAPRPGRVPRSRSCERGPAVGIVQRRALAADVRQPHRDVAPGRRPRPLAAVADAGGRAQSRNRPPGVARPADEASCPARCAGPSTAPATSRHSGITAQVISVVPQITSTSPVVVGPGDELLGEARRWSRHRRGAVRWRPRRSARRHRCPRRSSGSWSTVAPASAATASSHCREVEERDAPSSP